MLYQNKTKLFCLPYAGGTSLVYAQWDRLLHPSIEAAPLELAGRGVRSLDRSYADIGEAVEDILKKIRKDILREPYAIFGHSLGALICYELAQQIRRERLPPPQHLFFSGRNAPHVKRENEKKYYLMDDDEFRDSVLKLGGTPIEIFEHRELAELFVPLLRNDFRLSESFMAEEQVCPLDNNISVLLGRADETVERAEEWKKYTTRNFQLQLFDGGHFFINSAAGQVIDTVNRTLLREAVARFR